MVKRYLQIQAIRHQDQLIPVWDEKVIFERNQIYHVKTWKPTYHFSDNSSASRDHTMYKKYENS